MKVWRVLAGLGEAVNVGVARRHRPHQASKLEIRRGAPRRRNRYRKLKRLLGGTAYLTAINSQYGRRQKC